MSIYDSSHPSSGDSKPTTKTKSRVKDWVTELFRSKGYRTWIMEETPAVIEGVPYHLDIGVLTRNKESFDEYNFWGIEIDYKTHESKTSDKKDYDKDMAFNLIGIPILRIRLEQLYGDKALSEAERDKMIWRDFYELNFIESGEMSGFVKKNRELSIKLKENQLTRCRNSKCSHTAQNHNLAGCNYQNTNKASLYCSCKEPFMVSDS